MAKHVYPSGEKFTAGANVPFWLSSSYVLAYQKLELNKETEVVIVGGGMAGINIAYCLAKAGKNVVVVEDGFIGSGETGRTTAHLTNALDDRYYKLEKLFGEENSRLIAHSHTRAIDFIEQTVIDEKIQCEFERVNGYLFRHPTDNPESLRKEYEACLRAGLDVELSTIMLGNKSMEKVLKFARQGQMHPIKYLKALCDAIIKNGGSIYTNTQAKEINAEGITTDQGFTIRANHVVVATNSPVNNKYVINLKQIAYQTYVIALKVKKDLYPSALWWDTGDFFINPDIPPYHYIRTQKLNETHDLLIVGGEDHPTGQQGKDKIPEEDRYSSLEKWAKRHFDGIEEVVHRWSGEVLEPADSLAFIGRNPLHKDNVYVVSGDSGNGMTHSTIAGMLIRDLILGRPNKLESIYSPSRFKLFKSGKLYFNEFIGKIKDYLRPGEDGKTVSDLEDIKIGEAAVIEYDGHKIGAFKDENNHMHFVDAECSHLGCIVKWNNDEKSWDCPCHGSRFTYEGHVMHGPANTPLTYHSQKIKSFTKTM
jgi:glycine/D-amino acid oxidase-like deaminating enzyme/nitrite reductase/ring-hydroxylating ferredoxin subunit